MITWVLLAAYNEEKNIGRLLDEIKIKGLKTLVVDDGSVDNTYALAREKADRVIKNECNLGKGAALKKGINYLLANEPFDYVLMMDADGQHSCDDIEKFISEAEKGGQFIVGNRINDSAAMPWIRVVTNKFMSWLISSMVGQKIFDSQCGFRLVKRDVLDKITLTTNRFEIESELLIKAAKSKFSIKNIPIKSIYFAKQESKINPFWDTLRFVKFILSVLKYSSCH